MPTKKIYSKKNNKIFQKLKCLTHKKKTYKRMTGGSGLSKHKQPLLNLKQTITNVYEKFHLLFNEMYNTHYKSIVEYYASCIIQHYITCIIKYTNSTAPDTFDAYSDANYDDYENFIGSIIKNNTFMKTLISNHMKTPKSKTQFLDYIKELSETKDDRSVIPNYNIIKIQNIITLLRYKGNGDVTTIDLHKLITKLIDASV